MSELDTRSPRIEPWWAAAPSAAAQPVVPAPVPAPAPVAAPAPGAAYPPSAPPIREKRRFGDLLVVGLLSAGLASGGTYAATRTLAAPATTQPATTASAPAAPTAAAQAPAFQADGSAPDWTATAQAVSPSVVAIKVASSQGEGEGSGVIIDSAGHVLTNNHVATGAGSGATISVTLDDGRTYAATIAGTDPSTDLAVLTLTDPPTDLRPITFGDSDALAVGAPVMAVGNPLGLAGTVTTGIVSALNRPVTTGASQDLRGGQTAADSVVTNAIQTSAAINPGNSGGALVTADGRLVGINSSIASLGSSSGQSGNIGIGFAIPSTEAKTIAEQLIATGTAKHAYLGVSSSDGTVVDGSSRRAAAIIKSVSQGTPAATAGLQAGDAVVAMNGDRVDSSLSLVAAIREKAVGSQVTLTIVRGGTRQDVPVTLTSRPTA